MIGFHIDMNIAQFTRPYLEKWLRELARLGYDTVIWEVENNIRWQTCPECVSPDAFSKDEFRDVLDLCRSLGLESVPLVQTIAHVEYVLKHDSYAHLAETPGKIDMYCPQNDDLVPFLHRWLDEYLDLFGDVKYFHIGADEAWWMGSCPKCAAFVEKHSLSELYIRHVNAVAAPLLEREITPVIWADMALHHNEALDLLDRRIMLFDWMYDIFHGRGKFWVWGAEWVPDDEVPPEIMRKFGRFLFPETDEPGRAGDTFYTADFLAAEGFPVATCPSSSSYGDNAFSPRNYYHMKNTFDSCRKGLLGPLEGSVLTSWTVHLHPWELQAAMIFLPPFVRKNPTASFEDCRDAFMVDAFGASDPSFWRACGLLSKRCLFTYTDSLGWNKSALPVPLAHAADVVASLKTDGKLAEELENCRARLAEYEDALSIFDRLSAKLSDPRGYLAWWRLAALNLVNRAHASMALLEKASGMDVDATAVLARLRDLKSRTDAAYEASIKPTRRRETVDWLFASVERALEAIDG